MAYISLSTSGGFTGGSSGIKLYMDGKLMKTQKFVASTPEIETFDKNIDLNIVQNLKNMFNTSVLSQKCDKPSNMSSVLIYKCGDVEYQWKFPLGECPDFLKNILDEFKL
jgi:hypothetical protein